MNGEAPLKRASRINASTIGEDTKPDAELQYLDITAVDSNGQHTQPQAMTFREAPSRARRRVLPGDTVLSTVRTYLKAIAHFEAPPDNLIASTGFATLSPVPGVDPRFLWRAVQAHDFVEQVVAESEGVAYPAIAPSKLGTIKLMLPSLPEQRRIANYLDEQTAKIDRLIELRRRQIELLAEQRAAAIQQAVTKGLDPSVPMKDSGLPWLGEIPAHWEVKRLKYYCRINPPISPECAPDLQDEVSFLPMERVGDNGNLDLSLTRQAGEVCDGFTPIQEGDLVIAKITPCFENGKGALCEGLAGGVAYGTTELIVLRAGPDIDRRYMYWLLHSHTFRKEGEASMKGSAGQKRVTDDFVRDFRVSVSSLPEQRRIANYLDEQTAKIDRLIELRRRQIELLAEQRAALINECVTGQRRVEKAEEGGSADR